MISATNLTKRFGGRTVFERLNFVVNPGEVLGVIGPNGSGKSTLLRVLAGALPPDEGAIEASVGGRIAMLRQGHADDPAAPVEQLFPRAFAAEVQARRLEAVAADLARAVGEAATRLADEYDALLATLEAAPERVDLGGLWAELSLRAVEPGTPAGALSGGELTKLGLIDLVASQPDALLLDEPTNHLDLDGVESVERLIAGFGGPVVLVSHDRALLDACVDRVLDLDPNALAPLFTGDYSAYADDRARREQELWERYRRQQREERALKRTISAIESRSRNIEQRTIHFHYRKRAMKVARRAVTLKARLERQAQSAGHLDRPAKPAGGFHGGFEARERSGTRVLSVRDATIEVAGRRLFEHLDLEVRRGDRVVIMGPNGSGKTTLLRAILGEHPVRAGDLSVAASASTGYLAQEDAAEAAPGEHGVTAIDLVRRARPMTEADANNFLHRFLFGHDQLRTPLDRLSYGERRRLALARLVLGGASLLLLDEPTNHLDLPSREAFEGALDGFEGAAIVVTHDRYFIDQFADEVLVVEGGRLVPV